jgi:hypothetical protein
VSWRFPGALVGTPAPLFNPRATPQVAQFDDRHFCLVVDDFLLNPDELVQFAAHRRAEFNSVDFSYYPGIYRMAPSDLADRLTGYFNRRRGAASMPGAAWKLFAAIRS